MEKESEIKEDGRYIIFYELEQKQNEEQADSGAGHEPGRKGSTGEWPDTRAGAGER